MEFVEVKTQYSQQVKHDAFLTMIKNKAVYMLQNLTRIEFQLREKTLRHKHQEDYSILNFSADIRSMVALYQIMINQIKVDMEMSDFKSLALAIEKLFTHLLNIVHTLIRACVRFAPVLPKADQQTNSQASQVNIHEYEDRTNEIKLREHMRFMFKQDDGEDYQQNSKLWQMIQSNTRSKVIECAKIEPNDLGKKIMDVQQSVYKNEADVSKLIQILEYNLTFQAEGINVPKLMGLHKNYSNSTSQILKKVQTILDQLKLRKLTSVNAETQTIFDRQITTVKAELKTEKQKTRRLLAQLSKQKIQSNKTLERLRNQHTRLQDQISKAELNSKNLKEDLKEKLQTNGHLKKQIQKLKEQRARKEKFLEGRSSFDYKLQIGEMKSNRRNSLLNESKLQFKKSVTCVEGNLIGVTMQPESINNSKCAEQKSDFEPFFEQEPRISQSVSSPVTHKKNRIMGISKNRSTSKKVKRSIFTRKQAETNCGESSVTQKQDGQKPFGRCSMMSNQSLHSNTHIQRQIQSKPRISGLNGKLIKNKLQKEQLQDCKFKKLRVQNLATPTINTLYSITNVTILEETTPETMTTKQIPSNNLQPKYEISRQVSQNLREFKEKIVKKRSVNLDICSKLCSVQINSVEKQNRISFYERPRTSKHRIVQKSNSLVLFKESNFLIVKSQFKNTPNSVGRKHFQSFNMAAVASNKYQQLSKLILYPA